MIGIKRIAWIVALLAAGLLICRVAEYNDMRMEQAKLHGWTRTLAPEEITLQGATEWVTGERHKVKLDAAGLEAFTAVLHAVPREAITERHNFAGTGDITFSVRCDRDADLQREEYVLKYKDGTVYFLFDSETATLYGDRDWKIDDDGLETYLRGLFPELNIP